MSNLAKTALEIAKTIQQQSVEIRLPPDEGASSSSEYILPFSLVKNTRGYIEKIVHQINGSYAGGWYDACAVMIRRLVETLIIETFEHHKIAANIQNSTGDYKYLKDLISITLSESTFVIGRNTKQALPRLKDIGDQSAHSRRFTAQRSDIDNIKNDLRTVVQELVYLARLK